MKLTPEKQKNLSLAILIVVILIVGMWYFFINTQRQSEKTGRTELTKLKEDVKQRSSAIVKEKNDRNQATVYQAYISTYEEQMPKGNPETWLVRTLSDLATQQKLQLSSTMIESLSELSDFKFKNQPYKLVGFRFEFKGEFNQIGKFIETLENKMPLMEVDDLSISAGSDVAPHIHSIAMRISMVTKS